MSRLFLIPIQIGMGAELITDAEHLADFRTAVTDG
jgi:hypothetical protein